ncbi:MAG TPA: hypothetical protein VFS00_11580, partial [Polyangiaceae bacterium]|nr:hypothetical protein [Polyangiaceae bacterium]
MSAPGPAPEVPPGLRPGPALPPAEGARGPAGHFERPPAEEARGPARHPERPPAEEARGPARRPERLPAEGARRSPRRSERLSAGSERLSAESTRGPARRPERDPAGNSVEAWTTRLTRAAARRHAITASGETTAFRLANEGADGLPRGVTVDVYGPYAVVHSHDAAGQTPYLAPLLEALEALGARGTYVKYHPRGASTLADPARDDVAPARPARGLDAPDPLWALEGGLPLLCRLQAGLATGLYLDQRDNRARVRAAA